MNSVASAATSSFASELIKGLPAAFVALVIGAIAAFLTWRQYEVARAKLKFDLFDRRFAIFQQTWEILSEVVIRGTREKNYGLATPFNDFLPQARFLFGKDISDYLDEASTNWADLHALEAERADLSGQERLRNIERARELRNWFEEEAKEGCKRTFGSYLNFERWK